MRLNTQREMFRKRVAEMLRRGLKSLDELDATEEAERLALEREASTTEEETPPTDTFDSDFLTSLDPSVAVSLYSDFNPSDPFWAGLGFGGRTPRAAQGT